MIYPSEKLTGMVFRNVRISEGAPKLSQGVGQNCVRNLRQSNI